jgi:tRNA dimethylallyltransferase
MQIYKHMDIVTDKLEAALRRKYHYHLMDMVEPTKEYSVARFCAAAEKTIQVIVKKGSLPVVIGGTGLYVNSLVDGIFKEGKKSLKVRQELDALADQKGLSSLYAWLKEIDPLIASKVNLQDKKRIIRALEVYKTTGQPLSELQKHRHGLAEKYDVKLFGLRRERSDLYQRIDQRVDFMVNAGLLDEVRQLLKKTLGPTAYLCICIRELEGFFKGQYELGEAIRLIKRNSRHFAKRQLTWFNKRKDIEWLDVASKEDSGSVASKIIEKLSLEGA